MKDRQGGFTLMEILVSLALLAIGFAGVMALYLVTVKANRSARQLDRSRVLAAQLMEDLRGKALPALGGDGDHPYDTVTATEGATYTRSYAVAEVNSDLVRLTVTVSYPDEDDQGKTNSAMLQLVRSKHDDL
jgi:type IV pilus modification protein PilV